MEMERCKLITCILPNDGTDRALQHALKVNKNITRATSLLTKGMAALADAKTKSGKLPEPTIVRMVRIVVDAGLADEVFDYVYLVAKLDRPGGGIIFMGKDIIASPYTLPTNVPDEA